MYSELINPLSCWNRGMQKPAANGIVITDLKK